MRAKRVAILVIVLAAIAALLFAFVARRSESALVRAASDFYAARFSDGALAARAFATERFGALLAAPVTADTATCGVRTPEQVRVTDGATFAGRGSATVVFVKDGTTTLGTLTFVREHGAWLIDSVSCGGDAEPSAALPAAGLVTVFSYDAERDLDDAENIQCSSSGLVPVSAPAVADASALASAIRTLVEEPLPGAAQGHSEFPLPGFALASADLTDGIATLTFVDPQFASGGGSCRVGILRAQIEATARAVPGVQVVRILPEDILQP